MFLPHLNAGTAPAPVSVDFVPGFDDVGTAPPEPSTYVPKPVDETEPEPDEIDETETDNATLPEFWQRETELQAFAAQYWNEAKREQTE